MGKQIWGLVIYHIIKTLNSIIEYAKYSFGHCDDQNRLVCSLYQLFVTTLPQAPRRVEDSRGSEWGFNLQNYLTERIGLLDETALLISRPGGCGDQ